MSGPDCEKYFIFKLKMMIVNDIPNTQGKIDDIKTLLEPNDMNLKLAEEVKLNIENDIDHPL